MQKLCGSIFVLHFSCLHGFCDVAFRSVPGRQPSEVYAKWRKHSQLLKDSDFSFQEPIMALRTVILEILMEKEMENSQRECFKDILTTHLVELSILARTFKNTQVIRFKMMSSHPMTFSFMTQKMESTSKTEASPRNKLLKKYCLG